MPRDTPLLATLSSEQAALMDGDRIGTGQILVNNPGGTAGRQHTHSAFADLGDIQVALFVEREVVRRDDGAAHGLTVVTAAVCTSMALI